MLGRTLRNISNNNNVPAQSQQNQADLKARWITSSTAQLRVSDENDVPAVGLARFNSKIPVWNQSKPSRGLTNLPINTNTTNGCGINLRSRSEQPVEVCKPPPYEDIDTDHNCFLLSDYAPEIYKYLRELEVKQGLNAGFLAKRTVAPSHRALLVNWLVDVHRSFNLCSETLYICVSMTDRFFARVEQVSKSHIQLVGITALFVAAKFEEIYYPEVNEFVAVCDNLYTKRDILRMELRILDVLKFELGCPVALHFLRRGSKAARVDGRTHMLAKYLCELMLLEYECAHWKPSLMAATALYVSIKLKMDESSQVWTSTTHHYTGYSEPELMAKTVPVVCKAILNSETSKHQNTRKKYQASKFMSISKFTPAQMETIRRLARPRSTTGLNLS